MRSRKTTEFFLGLLAASSASIVSAQTAFVAGPVEVVSAETGQLTVLGQTYLIDAETVFRAAGKRAFQVERGKFQVGDFVAIEADSASVPLRAASVASVNALYTPGASSVFVGGTVERRSLDLATIKIGGLVVDISGTSPEVLSTIIEGSFVQVAGIQPTPAGLMLGQPIQVMPSVLSIGGTGASASKQSIGGTGGVSLQSIGGTGARTSKQSIGGTGGVSLQSIGGTGARTSKLSIGSTGGVSLQSIGGTGVRTSKLSIGGTGGVSLQSIGGTGARTSKLSIGGTGGASLQSIGGTGGVSLQSIGGTGARISKQSIGGTGGLTMQSIGGTGASTSKQSIGGTGAVTLRSIGGTGAMTSKQSIGGTGGVSRQSIGGTGGTLSR